MIKIAGVPFKPLLADPVDFDHIDYENTWLSPKYDGIRAIVIDGVVYSRNLKPIRNRYVQARLSLEHYQYADGELIVGDPTAKDCYRVTNSGVMAEAGEPDFKFYVFDHIEKPTDEYHRRYLQVGRLRNDPYVVVVEQHGLRNHDDLLDLENFYLEKGYEGVMLRTASGPRSYYKFGRSTAREGILTKLKRFVDAEAVIVGVEEELANTNEATLDALGHTKRSQDAAGLVGKGSLGALVCRWTNGKTFKIGTGYDRALRNLMWQQRDHLPGKLAKFKFFEAAGGYDVPRFPVFLGLRDPIDA